MLGEHSEHRVAKCRPLPPGDSRSWEFCFHFGVKGELLSFVSQLLDKESHPFGSAPKPKGLYTCMAGMQRCGPFHRATRMQSVVAGSCAVVPTCQGQRAGRGGTNPEPPKSLRLRNTQRAQYPLIKEYTLNH